MKRFAFTLLVLAFLAAVGQSAAPDAKNVADGARPAPKRAVQKPDAAPAADPLDDPFALGPEREVKADDPPAAPAAPSPADLAERRAAERRAAERRAALNAAERQIRQALDQPTQFEFVKTPLHEVVENLKNQRHIDIQLDLPALKEVGVDESTPVTCRSRSTAPRPAGKEAKDIPLGPGLVLMLEPMHLKYVVRNGALWITSPPNPERRIHEALDQQTQIEFVDTPLKDVIEFLKDLHSIEIQLDLPALHDGGAEENTAVTMNLKGISLRSALRLMLDELQLSFVIHNDVLLITSPKKADSFLETRAYPVQDLVLPDRDGAVDLQPLTDLLTTTVAPKSWTCNIGRGSLAEFAVGDRLLLVVSQTQEVHGQIEHVLDLLRKAGGLKTAPQHAAVDEAAEQRIRQALDAPTQLEFVDTPLKDVVEYLKDLHHFEIQLDGPALRETGLEESCPVTKNLKDISLRKALKLLLDELQLKYVVRNSVLSITTPAKAESYELMETRVYPVADLVLPDRRDGPLDLQHLKNVLTTTVAAESWTAGKGDGGIAGIVVANRPLLVVWQTQDVHEQIQGALDLLRKAGGLDNPDASNPKVNAIHLKKTPGPDLAR
jgi:hypothetical protein